MTANSITLAALVAVSYLLGSIPTGLLLGKMYGVDVREAGSGNIGATNLYRTVGRKIGLITLAGDCFKGLIPVFVAQYFGLSQEVAALAGLAAFCGHVFSIFLKFKGGKGVATALGVFLAISPASVGIAFVLFLLLVFKWRYVSLGSISGAAVVPFVLYFLGKSEILVFVASIISITIILRHHENIRRILSGTESRFKC